jgi:hypothetical protein
MISQVEASPSRPCGGTMKNVLYEHSGVGQISAAKHPDLPGPTTQDEASVS